MQILCDHCIHNTVCEKFKNRPTPQECCWFIRKPATSYWLHGTTGKYFTVSCFQCDKSYRLTDMVAKFKYCPNCGSRMKEGET